MQVYLNIYFSPNLPGSIHKGTRLATVACHSPTPSFVKQSREPLDKLISKILDRCLEVIIVIRLPIRRSTRNSLITGKRNIENICLIMTTVAIHLMAITGSGERKTSFPNKRNTVVAIGVSPHSIDLYAVSQSLETSDLAHSHIPTYHHKPRPLRSRA